MIAFPRKPVKKFEVLNDFYKPAQEYERPSSVRVLSEVVTVVPTESQNDLYDWATMGDLYDEVSTESSNVVMGVENPTPADFLRAPASTLKEYVA